MSYEHSHSCHCETCFQLRAYRDKVLIAERNPEPAALENSGVKGRYNPDDVTITMSNGASISYTDDSWKLSKTPEREVDLTMATGGGGGGISEAMSMNQPFEIKDRNGTVRARLGVLKDTPNGFEALDENGNVRVRVDIPNVPSRVDLADFVKRNTTQRLSVPIGAPGYSNIRSKFAEDQAKGTSTIESIRGALTRDINKRALHVHCSDTERAALNAMSIQLNAILDYLENTRRD